MYKIRWVSTFTGLVGVGALAFDTLEEAKEICKDLNGRFSGILHTVIYSDVYDVDSKENENVEK